MFEDRGWDKEKVISAFTPLLKVAEKISMLEKEKGHAVTLFEAGKLSGRLAVRELLDELRAANRTRDAIAATVASPFKIAPPDAVTVGIKLPGRIDLHLKHMEDLQASNALFGSQLDTSRREVAKLKRRANKFDVANFEFREDLTALVANDKTTSSIRQEGFVERLAEVTFPLPLPPPDRGNAFDEISAERSPKRVG